MKKLFLLICTLLILIGQSYAQDCAEIDCECTTNILGQEITVDIPMLADYCLNYNMFANGNYHFTVINLNFFGCVLSAYGSCYDKWIDMQVKVCNVPFKCLCTLE